MLAISDSSPIILLSGIGHLALLRYLFDAVLIPTAVRDEVVRSGQGRAGAAELAAADWVQVQPLTDRQARDRLPGRLGPGEAAVLALALEVSAPVTLVLDDSRARRVAAQLGFPVIGTAGILRYAKQDGRIAAVRPLLDAVRAAGLYLSDAVYQETLAAAGEAPA